ncbi:hypothetical protein [Streptosporangium sp. KLBMP 9127]|nr:hypothetical protein [Streptosporangium sp. KLBMP 9127]
MSPDRDGYSVRWATLRRESAVFRAGRDEAAAAKAALLEAFDQDRATLGGDMYGVELAKRLPGIEQEIFEAFDAYLDELDGTGESLRVSAANYESVDQPTGRHS